MRRLITKQIQKQADLPIRSTQTRKIARKPNSETHPLLQLQRTIGNQAVLRLLRMRETNRAEVNSSAQSGVPPIVHEALHSPSQGLNQGTREFMESRFEHDFSQVRVHTDETAADAAQALHANAFTVGRDIVFGEGKFAPNSTEGQRLLAHELTHSVQQTTGPAKTSTPIQCDDQTDKDVKAVKSGNVALREKEFKTAETQLEKRMAKRQLEIQKLIDEIGPNPKSEKSKTRLKALQKDLAKDLATIIKEPDSDSVYKGHRKDIKESSSYVDTQKLKLTKAQDQWSKYDALFAGKEVATALGKQTITAAEFKALIAQESGELTKNDKEGKIAGIAQLGPKEEKLGGGKPGDRLIPEKALVISANLLTNYANQLDKGLGAKPEGEERKKFIMGAYNSGVTTIITAQREAIKMGRDGKTWQSLIEGGDKSPLYKAIVAHYPKKTDFAATYKEKSEYPITILSRL